jgi:hypothetical protein
MPHKRTIPRTCRQCGASFFALAAQVNVGRAKYCSRACANLAKRKPKKAVPKPPPRNVPRDCRECSAPFLTTKHAINHGKGFYCSHACFMAYRHKPEPRFWKNVEKGEGCWLWKGLLSAGYGQLRVGEKQIGAHRYSWELHNGPIPEGLFICHRCDNRRCVRPDHLFLGTCRDNLLDALAKGRIAIGERSVSYTRPETRRRGSQNGLAKLTEEQVGEIRRRYAAGGVTQLSLAQQFGVDRTLISLIVRRKGWKHV